MSASEFIPETGGLQAVREAAAGCRGCHLYEKATQTVFGEGPRSARIMLVGEMAGDREDREGRPFVGPAGRELERALEAAGIERREVYVTNVVKHFKFEERGKRRIHQKPTRSEVKACLPWLREELRVVAPEALFRLTRERGRALESNLAPFVTATIHPSAILRARDDASRSAERRAFRADLALAARHLAEAE